MPAMAVNGGENGGERLSVMKAYPVRVEKWFDSRHGGYTLSVRLSDGVEIEYTDRALVNLMEHDPAGYRRLQELIRPQARSARPDEQEGD